MPRRLASLLAVAAALWAAGGAPAFCNEHLMVVQEVFPGTPADPNAQYVMLRMTSSTQNFVNTSFIEVQGPTGTILGRFGTFTHDMAAGGTAGCVWPNCPAILIGTGRAQMLLGLTLDQVVDAEAGRVALPLAGGRVCFRINIGYTDCVAYGNYTGPSTATPGANICDDDYGAPAPALLLGWALQRKTFFCSDKVSSTDFANRFPRPVTNSGANFNTDTDGDGLIDILDCADAGGTSLYFPIETQDLLVASGSPTSISWTTQNVTTGSSTRYDLVTGNMGSLLASRDYSAASCLASAVAGGSTTDPNPDPPPGAAVYYLVRTSNGCGHGTYGNSTLAVDPRDALDTPGTIPCP
jgi:hypothetical protein